MKHLIEHHGYKKLAFVQALPTHPYAKERFESYKKILKKYKIPLNDKLISLPGDFSYHL